MLQAPKSPPHPGLWKQICQGIVSTFSEPAWIASADHRELFCLNVAAEAIFGVSADELLTDSSLLPSLVHPDDRELFQIAERTFGEADQSGLVYRIVRSDGSVCRLNENRSVLADDSGVPLAVLSRAEELKAVDSAPVRSTLELQTSVPDVMCRLTPSGDFLEFVNAPGANMYSPPETYIGKNLRDVFPPDVAEPCQSALKRACETGEMQVCRFTIYENDRAWEYEARGALCRDGTISAFICDVTYQRLAAEKLKSQQAQLQVIADALPAWVCHVDSEGRYRFVNKEFAGARGQSPEEMLGRTTEEVWGKKAYEVARPYIEEALAGRVATFDYEHQDKAGNRRIFSVSYVPDLSRQGHPQGYFALITDVTEQRDAAKRVQASERELRLIAERVQAMIAHRDANHRYLFVNHRYAATVGHSPDDCIGRTTEEILGHDTYCTILPHLQEALQGREIFYDLKWHDPELGERIYYVAYTPDFHPDGTVQGYLTLATDVTEQRDAALRLQTSEAELRLITEGISASVCHIGADQRYIFVNSRFAAAVNRTQSECIGRTVREVVGEETYTTIRPYIEEALCGKETSYDIVWNDPELGERTFNVAYTPYRRGDGEVHGYVTLITDVTDHRRAAEQLVQSESQLRLIIDSIPAAIAYIDTDERYRFVNQQLADIFGLRIDGIIGHSVCEIVGEEAYRDRVSRHLNAGFRGRSSIYEVAKNDYRNESRLYNVSTVPDFDEQKNVRGLLSLTIDRTEEKRAAEALRSHEEHLQHIAANVPGAIFQTEWSSDGRRSIRYISEGGAELYGIPLEVLNSGEFSPLQLVADEDRSRFEENIRACAATMSTLICEYRTNHPHKSDQWVRVSATPTRLPDGGIVWHGVIVDITDRKRAEQALESSESRLQHITSNLPGVIVQTTRTPDGRRFVSYVSGRVEEIYGVSLEVANSGHFDPIEFIAVEERDRVIREGMRSHREMSTWIFEHRVNNSTNEDRWVRVSATPEARPDGSIIWNSVTIDVTDEKKAEESQRDSEVRLREAQRIAQLGDWHWDLRNNELHWCDEVYRIFGYVPRTPGSTFDLFWKAVHAEDHERVQAAADAALSGGKTFSIDHRIVLLSGEIRTVHEEGLVSFDDPEEPVWMHGTVQDITERKAVEDALRDSEERHRSVVTALDEGIVLQFADGIIVTCNSSAERILGLPRERILGRPPYDQLWDPIHEDGAPFPVEEHPATVTLKTGKALRDIVMGLRKSNGETTWISMNSQPMFQPGENRPYAVVTSFADITAQKLAQEKLRQHEAELAQVYRVSVMGEMASHLAHELNQPLGAIGIYVESAIQMLKSERIETTRVSAALQRAVQQAHRSAQIVHRLREFIRKRDPIRAPVNVNNLIDEVCDLCEPESRHTGVIIWRDRAANLPSVMADSVQIEQVLLNLVRNAIEAMKEVHNRSRKLTLRTRCQFPDSIEVEVIDTGPGVSDELLPKLFEPFVTTKPHGMGMGLSICRSIIEAHGGKLWAIRNPEGGMTFQFSLPVCEGEMHVNCQ